MRLTFLALFFGGEVFALSPIKAENFAEFAETFRKSNKLLKPVGNHPYSKSLMSAAELADLIRVSDKIIVRNPNAKTPRLPDFAVIQFPEQSSFFSIDLVPNFRNPTFFTLDGAQQEKLAQLTEKITNNPGFSQNLRNIFSRWDRDPNRLICKIEIWKSGFLVMTVDYVNGRLKSTNGLYWRAGKAGKALDNFFSEEFGFKIPGPEVIGCIKPYKDPTLNFYEKSPDDPGYKKLPE